jgi:LysM repeat protein
MLFNTWRGFTTHSVLVLLCAAVLTAAPALAVKTHTMVAGDTLWDLSSQFYGDPTLYPVFLEVNSIDNPRTIPVGKVIIVPSFDEIKKIAAEPDPAKRRDLISRIQGDAGSSTTSNPTQPAPGATTYTPPDDRNRPKADWPSEKRDVRFRNMMESNIPADKVIAVDTEIPRTR